MLSFQNRKGIFIGYALLLFLNLGVLNILDYFFDFLYDYQTPYETFYTQIVDTVIIAPIKETFVYFALPYLLLSQILKVNNFIATIVIATRFSLAHHTQYDIELFIYYLITGVIMAWYYKRMYNNGSILYALVISILLHAAFNFILTLLSLYLIK